MNDTKKPLGNSAASQYSPVPTKGSPILSIILIAVGLCLFLAGFLIFILGHHPEQIIFNLSNSRRMILAFCICLVASGSVIFGFKKHKNRGITIAGILSAGLLYLPLHYKDAYDYERHVLPQLAQNQYSEKDNVKTDSPEPISHLETLSRVVDQPAFEAFKQEHPDKKAVTILIDSIKNIHLAQVTELLEDSIPHDNAFKIFKTSIPVKEMPALCVFLAYPEGREKSAQARFKTIVTKISPTALEDTYQTSLSPECIAPFPDKDEINTLSTVLKTKLYSLFLPHLSLSVQHSSLNFFKQTDTLAYAPEVLQEFRALLHTRDQKFKIKIVEALSNWRKLINNYPGELIQIDAHITQVNGALLYEMQQATEQNLTISDKIINYLSTYRVEGSERILFYAWEKNPLSSERALLSAGPLSERALLPHLESLDKDALNLACRILNKTGSNESLPSLQKLKDQSSTKKIKTTLQSTIDEIKKRH